MFSLHHGDCLEVMREIPDASVDMILCDLPYGTTACKWDSVIPFDALWEQYRRVAKKDAAIVLTASQPFTTMLIHSNIAEFKYEWIWRKNNGSNFALLKTQPMKEHESVCVFSRGRATYSPQMQERSKNNNIGRRVSSKRKSEHQSGAARDGFERPITPKLRYPSSVQEFDVVPRAKGTLHPTQKPVALMEYLIRTYTIEGDMVMDNCMGSGTTGVACANTNRKFIGIERDDRYFEIAKARIEQATQSK